MLIRRNAAGAWLRASIAVLGLSMLAACGGGGGGDDEPTLDRVELTPANESAPLGTTQQFTATAILSDDSHRDVTDLVSWSSSNTAVATIGNASPAQGLAETTGLGTTTITAAYEGQTVTTTLTVTAAEPVSVSVTPMNPTVAKGTTQQFVASARFTDDSVRTVTEEASWSSATPATATVGDGGASGAKGLARGVNVGGTQIRATYQGVTGSAVLNVSAATISSIAVTPATASVAAGTTQQFVAVATLSDGSTQPVTAQASWTSSDTARVTVSDAAASKGLAKGESVGNATVTASLSGQSGSATLTVSAAVLRSLTLTPAAASVAKGLSQQYTATGTYSDGSVQDLSSTVTWSSSTATVATISNAGGSQGLVKTLGEGSTTIRAVDPATSIAAETGLTVTAATLARLELTPPNASLPAGASRQFAVTGFYTDDTRTDLTQSATWSTGSVATADVSNAENKRGIVLAKAAGSTTIGAAFGGLSASSALTVTDATLSLIQVTPSNEQLAAGFTRQYVATGIYSDNSRADLTTSVNWSTAATANATVSNAEGSAGLVTGVAAGATSVTAQLGGVSGSTPVRVTGATLRSIAVSPTDPSIALGLQQAFTAIGTFTDDSTQDLTTQLDWNSSLATVATISNAAGSQGVATSVGQGETTITASRRGTSVAGTTTLTVNAKTVTKITVEPAAPTLAKGSSREFTATATYTDGSTATVTRNATWSSSNTAVATVTNGAPFGTGSYGVVSAQAVGTATIRATFGGQTGASTLTVSAAALRSIAITPANTSVAKGVAVTYKATGTYTDSTTQDITKAVTWGSADAAIAELSNAEGSQGQAATNGTGTTSITARQGDITGTTQLTVTPATLVSVAVTPATPSIPKGSNQQFEATGTYTDGSTVDLTTSVSWSSSATAVATISNAAGTRGLATSVAPGTTTISAVSGTGGAARTGTTTLTVTPATLQSIAVTPASANVVVGYFQQFVATGSYADGSTKDITEEVSWSVFDDAIASVSNTAGSRGRTTGVSAGTTAVSATLGGVSGSASVNVTAATLSSITVSSPGATVSAGQTMQFTATGNFTGGVTMDLSRQVTWLSTNTSAATIDQNGLATAGSFVGVTTIRATRGSGGSSVSGEKTLTRTF